VPFKGDYMNDLTHPTVMAALITLAGALIVLLIKPYLAKKKEPWQKSSPELNRRKIEAITKLNSLIYKFATHPEDINKELLTESLNEARLFASAESVKMVNNIYDSLSKNPVDIGYIKENFPNILFNLRNEISVENSGLEHKDFKPFSQRKSATPSLGKLQAGVSTWADYLTKEKEVGQSFRDKYYPCAVNKLPGVNYCNKIISVDAGSAGRFEPDDCFNDGKGNAIFVEIKISNRKTPNIGFIASHILKYIERVKQYSAKHNIPAVLEVILACMEPVNDKDVSDKAKEVFGRFPNFNFHICEIKNGNIVWPKNK